MTEAKIEVQIGEFSFSGAGDQQWLSKELDKILSKSSELIKLNKELSQSKPPAVNQNAQQSGDADMSVVSAIANKALAKFLNEQNANKVQNQKFLATAVWLHEKGSNRLATKDISSALKNANQTKINNPSLCLNSNVSRGLCEKDGAHFFVTEDGRKAIGL